MGATDLADLKAQMGKAFEVVVGDVATIRTSRASPALVEEVNCSVYNGSQTLKLKELASITAANTQTLVITPWDQTILDQIYKSLMGANLGITLLKEANLIRVKLPPLTGERRQDYIKLLGKKLEGGRVMIRQLRRDEMVAIKQAFEAKQLNEDEKFRLEQEVQEVTDEFIAKIDELGRKKEAELLSV